MEIEGKIMKVCFNGYVLLNNMSQLITKIEEYAKERDWTFISLNKFGDTYRVNFKEYDGDGYIIHKVLLKDII